MQKRTALISVVIPSYNCAHLLERAVVSAYQISEHRIEVIVVDDGSTDQTPDLCLKLKETFDNLIVIRQKNSGLSVARNTGVAASTGTFVVLLDADDQLMPANLSEVENFSGDILRIGVEEVSPQGVAKTRRSSKSPLITGTEYLSAQLTNGDLYIPSWAYIYRRSFLQASGLQFRPRLIHEDELFTIQALLAARSVGATSSVLYRYIRREGSITTSASLESIKRRMVSLTLICSELIKLANQHPTVDLWKRATFILEYAWSVALGVNTPALRWLVFKAELSTFMKYKGWGKAHQFKEERHRLRTALTRLLLGHDQHQPIRASTEA